MQCNKHSPWDREGPAHDATRGHFGDSQERTTKKGSRAPRPGYGDCIEKSLVQGSTNTAYIHLPSRGGDRKSRNARGCTCRPHTYVRYYLRGNRTQAHTDISQAAAFKLQKLVNDFPQRRGPVSTRVCMYVDSANYVLYRHGTFCWTRPLGAATFSDRTPHQRVVVRIVGRSPHSLSLSDGGRTTGRHRKTWSVRALAKRRG